MDSEYVINPMIPITTLSYDIPMLKYTISNGPLIFGESRFEYGMLI